MHFDLVLLKKFEDKTFDFTTENEPNGKTPVIMLATELDLV